MSTTTIPGPRTDAVEPSADTADTTTLTATHTAPLTRSSTRALPRSGGAGGEGLGPLRVGRTRSPGHVPGWWKDLVGAATWASLLVVTAMWVANGGVAAGMDVGESLTSFGRLLGLLGSDLLLVQVLLMARIPLVEKAYGQDELAVIHRLVGFASFTLVMAHVVITVVGYAGARLSALWPTTLDVVLELSGMLLALAGTICLVLVVVTSIKKARAKLRYESWHLLHLYAYLGCFLALPHQLWTGADFLASPVATAYWWGLWGAAVIAVVAYRVVLPLVKSRRHNLVVSDVRERGNVTVVTMTGREMDRLGVAAGQFFQWRFLDGPGWTRAHPYSISAAPNGSSLEISVARVGDGSSRLASLPVGTKVLIEGPYGRLHPGVRTRKRVTLMASGIGVAPMKSILEALPADPGDVTLVYRVSSREGAPLLDEVAAAASARGVRILLLEGHRLVGRESWLPQGWEHVSDVDALRHLVPDIATHDVYVCGASGWMTATEAALVGAGVPQERIHIERFAY